jgi:hypothetical protein
LATYTGTCHAVLPGVWVQKACGVSNYILCSGCLGPESLQGIVGSVRKTVDGYRKQYCFEQRLHPDMDMHALGSTNGEAWVEGHGLRGVRIKWALAI